MDEKAISNMIQLHCAGTANIALSSTLDERQTACPGEVVTYTCTAPRTTVVSWFALPDVDGVDYFPSSQPGEQVMGDFRIALINNIANGLGTADLTTTLTITATAGRNRTVVECRGDDPSERMSLVLNIASKYIIVCSQYFTTDHASDTTVVLLV